MNVTGKVTDYAIKEAERITFATAIRACNGMKEMPNVSDEYKRGCNACARTIEALAVACARKWES
jgi:hypothetical protein